MGEEKIGFYEFSAYSRRRWVFLYMVVVWGEEHVLGGQFPPFLFLLSL